MTSRGRQGNARGRLSLQTVFRSPGMKWINIVSVFILTFMDGLNVQLFVCFHLYLYSDYVALYITSVGEEPKCTY